MMPPPGWTVQLRMGCIDTLFILSTRIVAVAVARKRQTFIDHSTEILHVLLLHHLSECCIRSHVDIRRL